MNSAELLSWVVTAIVLPGLGVVLRVGMPPALEWLRASIRSRDAGRLAESFVAGAGRIALDVVTARQAGPNVDIRRIVAEGVKREGADIVGNIMKDTAAKLGVSRADAEKAVAGRLGPILNEAEKSAAETARVIDGVFRPGPNLVWASDERGAMSGEARP